MEELNLKKFSAAINKKLEGTSIRKEAEKMKIHHTSLHRASKGTMVPDGNNLIKILNWLGKDLKEFE